MTTEVRWNPDDVVEEVGRDEMKLRMSPGLKASLIGIALVETEILRQAKAKRKMTTNRLVESVLENFVAAWLKKAGASSAPGEKETDEIARLAEQVRQKRAKEDAEDRSRENEGRVRKR